VPALDVQELFQDVANLDEGCGVFHHFIDVLAPGRNLTEQTCDRRKSMQSIARSQVGHRDKLSRFVLDFLQRFRLDGGGREARASPYR